MNRQRKLGAQRLRRQARVRAKIFGTATLPRLSVRRSVAHIHVQLIDDEKGVTLASASDVGQKMQGTKTEKARLVGMALASAAKDKGITKAIFDRGSAVYTGRVRALAEAARESGLDI